jgi:hypothetical protein
MFAFRRIMPPHKGSPATRGRVAGEAYRRRKGRYCVDIKADKFLAIIVLRDNLIDHPKKIPIAMIVIQKPKTGANNQRAWPTLSSICSS